MFRVFKVPRATPENKVPRVTRVTLVSRALRATRVTPESGASRVTRVIPANKAPRVTRVILESKVPRATTKIGTRAFNDNDDLRIMSLPSTITYLGKRLFGTCSKDTITINYNGTTQEMNAIETPSDIPWYSLNDSTIKVVCSNGTLTY